MDTQVDKWTLVHFHSGNVPKLISRRLLSTIKVYTNPITTKGWCGADGTKTLALFRFWEVHLLAEFFFLFFILFYFFLFCFIFWFLFCLFVVVFFFCVCALSHISCLEV